MQGDSFELGRLISHRAEEVVNEAFRWLELARYVRVATTAELGESPFSTRISPNGNTQNLAAVWLDGDSAGKQPVKLPVAPGVTIQEGKVVYVVRDRAGGPWTWILFQL